MADAIRVMIELGRKKAVAVASAFDWPGWNRSGKSEEDALQVLAAYRPRYAKVAELAGLAGEFREARKMAVVERLEGTGMTDFYGLSARSAGPEHEPMSDAACDRKIALLRASWTYFDDVASRVSPELRKGPRGGGRDRDKIVRHVSESDWYYAREMGLRDEQPDPTDRAAVMGLRAAMLEVLGRPSDGSPLAGRKWPARYAAARIAWHALDHAWEIEDRTDA